jgi:hypothetical protein
LFIHGVSHWGYTRSSSCLALAISFALALALALAPFTPRASTISAIVTLVIHIKYEVIVIVTISRDSMFLLVLSTVCFASA